MNAKERPGRLLLRWAALWLLALATIGIYMRLGTVFPWLAAANFQYLVHAHSHTAYFGWAGMGMMGLILELLPALTGRSTLAAPRAVALLVWLTPWTVGVALLAFWWQGYGPASIATATVNQLIWYVFAYAFYAQVRALPVRRWPPALLLLGTAVFYLLVATAGTWFLTIMKVTGVSDPILANAGVVLFLHAYADGWLELGVAGAAVALLPGLLGVGIDRPQWLRWQVGLALVLIVPAFLRLLIPYGLNGPLAQVGHVAGLLLVVPEGLFLAATLRAWRAASALRRGPAAAWLAAAWLGLAAKLTTELVPLVPGWQLLAASRQGLIAYLHLKLLAFFTAALLGLVAHLFAVRLPRAWVAVYQVGTAALVMTLISVAIWTPQAPWLVRPLLVGALVFNLLPAVALVPVAWPVARGLWRSAARSRPQMGAMP